MLHASEVGLSAAADSAILAWARRRRRTVVTLDADFHALMALSGARKPAVVRIRIEGLKAEGLSLLMQAVLARCTADLGAGALVTVDPAGIRIRRLPIAKRPEPR